MDEEQRKQTVFSAAAELFMTQGVENTTIEHIANKADVATTFIAETYPSKEDMLVDVLAASFNFDDSDVVDTITSHYATHTVAEKVYFYVEKRLEGLEQFPKGVLLEMFSIMFNLAQEKPSYLQQFVELDFFFVDDFISFLNVLKEKGEVLSDYPSNQAAETLYSVLAFEFVLYLFEAEHSQQDLLSGINRKIQFLFP